MVLALDARGKEEREDGVIHAVIGYGHSLLEEIVVKEQPGGGEVDRRLLEVGGLHLIAGGNQLENTLLIQCL